MCVSVFTKNADKQMKLCSACDHSIFLPSHPFFTHSLHSSKEQSSHPSTDALSVIQDVKLVDELVHAVAGLGYGA